MLKVIGAGFGRTGTLSLKFALEKLGFTKCYHMMEVRQHEDHLDVWRAVHRGEPVDWERLFEGYQASVDWPSCNFWREQLLAFPDAKVILSQRDPERWHASVLATIYKMSSENLSAENPKVRAGAEWAREIIRDRVFDGRVEDADWAIERFRAHSAAVQAEVPAERLLVFEAAQGWGPLCEFLEVPVPDEDYPRVNTTEQFTEIFENPPAEA
ncbi:MAG: sulfotransferase family protein [Pseudomonadota bacterium]